MDIVRALSVIKNPRIVVHPWLLMKQELRFDAIRVTRTSLGNHTPISWDLP